MRQSALRVSIVSTCHTSKNGTIARAGTHITVEAAKSVRGLFNLRLHGLDCVKNECAGKG
jgi:hypothetical protein